MAEPDRAAEAGAALKFFAGADTERLLAMIVALGGEVFVLKAELQRLRMCLASAGLVDDAALATTAESPAYRAWQAGEENAFGRHLLRPFVHPDDASRVGDLVSGVRPRARGQA